MKELLLSILTFCRRGRRKRKKKEKRGSKEGKKRQKEKKKSTLRKREQTAKQLVFLRIILAKRTKGQQKRVIEKKGNSIRVARIMQTEMRTNGRRNPMDLVATRRNHQEGYVVDYIQEMIPTSPLVHLVYMLNLNADMNLILSSSCVLCSLLMNQIMEAVGIKDTREIIGMVLVRMVIMRSLKMVNLVKEGRVGSYFHP